MELEIFTSPNTEETAEPSIADPPASVDGVFHTGGRLLSVRVLSETLGSLAQGMAMPPRYSEALTSVPYLGAWNGSSQ